jgi:hypothetical protein
MFGYDLKPFAKGRVLHLASPEKALLDLKRKMKDFEHLLFNRNHSSKILRIPDFFKEL